MHSFFARTSFANPGLHVWREGTSIRIYLRPESPPAPDGWVEFRCDLQGDICCEPVKFMLFDFKADNSPGQYEKNEHQRELPRRKGCDFPEAVWFTQDAARVVTRDPRLSSQSNLRVHLISQTRFRPGQMYLWDPVTNRSRRISQSGENDLGPIFDVQLEPHDRSFVHFKFLRKFDEEHPEFEVDIANRWWVADDGTEIWIHSGTAAISRAVPHLYPLKMHYRQSFEGLATMRLWSENGDYETDIVGVSGGDGWTTFEANLYAHLPYSCLFWNPGAHRVREWEHTEAKRQQIAITQPAEFWTLEGDNHLFSARPAANVQLDLTVANRDLSKLRDSLFAHVWINRARGPLVEKVAVDTQGCAKLRIYPDVVTSVKFFDEHGRWEQIDRHSIRLAASDSPVTRYVVLDRPQLLAEAPAPGTVSDPPFTIRRPGAYVDGDAMRFALHAPQAARVDLIGEWTGWLEYPIAMKTTRDGTYWWASIPIQEIEAGLPSGMPDYHGAKYQFLFDEHRRLQDPAAGWVERSNENSNSRMIRPDRYDWHDRDWHRPGWESLIVYQLHPSRFTNRFQNEPPLRRVAREISHHSGYIRELGATAIQLMPINEVGSDNSWGYDPAYFYAVENNYCGEDGPDDLKYLVDTCHQHGLAVIVDVVFNHAGGTHNILWQIARESYFDGDTEWGAMINFDHPQCRHYFAQNLVYLANEFHIDGFRLDHTATIVHSAAWDPWSLHVRKLGSGGGWEFLQTLRHAVTTQVGHNCLLTAEHLPNEWSLTNYGGPMDSQWCDDFHDRVVDACKRKFGMSRLAAAFQLSHSACDDWYKITNYAESHDEVGNVRDRVAYLAEYGQGWRMSKVAAAATLLSRGIPLFFMGGESGEDRQFHVGGSDPLDLAEYLSNPDRGRIRAWWRDLCHLRRNPSIQGPAPLRVVLAESQLLAFTRGVANDFYILLNFGGWSGERSLESLNLPWGRYRELFNSTWPAFAIQAEHEDEHTNGGRDARLQRYQLLNVPDYGVVILERV